MVMPLLSILSNREGTATFCKACFRLEPGCWQVEMNTDLTTVKRVQSFGALDNDLARIIREYAASGGWRREVAVKMLVAL
jgi:hypothetical protein